VGGERHRRRDGRGRRAGWLGWAAAGRVVGSPVFAWETASADMAGRWASGVSASRQAGQQVAKIGQALRQAAGG